MHDELKKAIGHIFLRVVQAHERYKTPEGFRRWGLIQEDVNAEIDKAFPTPQYVNSSSKPVAWTATSPHGDVLHISETDGWKIEPVLFDGGISGSEPTNG